MKLSRLHVVGMFIVTAVAVYSSISISSLAFDRTEDINLATGLMMKLDLDKVGRTTTLSEVETSMNLKQPLYLPPKTSLYQVKVIDNKAAILMYKNQDIGSITVYRPDVQIVVLAQKDDTSFETHKSESEPKVTIIEDGKESIVNVQVVKIGENRSRIVTISGNLGFGYGPADLPWHDSGRVQWWSGGIHYQVLADLPLEELIKIAESIPNI